MRQTALDKEIKDLEELAKLLEKGSPSNPDMIINRAIRRLKEQQAQLRIKTRPAALDLRPKKMEEAARLAAVGKAYLKQRRVFTTPDGSILQGFHTAVDDEINKS